ncbi:FkbM family methyltransferase [uncultured Algibacter sp.]|uniref:FkbM family methyltransferase n=1 Tax=uncultured Algibacter sp. TaxID=298659 RepID=UPI002633A680|nr:FkbM family methyltransferase [uncultured Algibacter sp.]
MIKSILKPIGLYAPLYNYYIKKKREKYANFDFCSMDFEGVKLKFNTKDNYSKSWFFPRFGNGYVHEPGATKIFIDNVDEDANVFDIGGHLGYFSCVAGILSKNGKVCVFEVDFNCIDLINKNIELNKLKNVKVHNIAVSDLCGNVSIPDLKFPNPGIRIESFKNKEQIKVASLTIDEYIGQENIIPNFIKIDVEGAEFKILKGMTNTLKSNKLILLIEIHVSQLLKYYDTDYKDVLKFLTYYGFKLEKVKSHRTKQIDLEEIKPTDILEGNIMILCRNH